MWKGGIGLEPQMQCFPYYQLLLSFEALKLNESNPETLFSQKSLVSKCLADILKIKTGLSLASNFRI